MKTINEQETLAYLSGDTDKADLLAQIAELEAQVETLEEQLSDAQDNRLEKWEKNNGPVEEYEQFFYDCFEHLGAHYPCPSVTSNYDCGVIFAAIERGEGVAE